MRSLLYICLVFAITLLSCNTSSVELKYTNAKGEVNVLQNFVFRFNKELVSDTMLNKWDSTEYISFSPAIPGRFRWQETDELVFSPAIPLSPATNYTATLNKAILDYSDFGRITTEEIKFYTPQLQLKNASVTWMLNESRTPVARAELMFNYEIDPQKIHPRISIKTKETTISHSLISLSKSNRMVVQLNGLKQEDEDIVAQLEIDKGIIPLGGQNPTYDPIAQNLYIPSPYRLDIGELVANHDGSEGKILIKTSQTITGSDLSSRIKIYPAVKFNASAADNGIIITSTQFDPEKVYDITLLKGISGEIGGRLKEDYHQQVSFGELYPAVSFQNSRAMYLSSKGNNNIGITIINVPRVKIIVSKIYESNLLASQYYGYYPKDRYDENYYYDDGAAPYVPGDVVYEKVIETSSLPGNGKSRMFEFNIEDKLPNFKGIYHIKIRSTEDYWISDSRFISKSDLGIIAKEGKDNIAVFVNSIHEANPVNGAQVLAYGSNNQLLGTATTDALGFASINLNRKNYEGFKPAMVIVKTPDDFNFIHFKNSLINTSRYDVGGRTGNPAGLDAFIYEERDIYRPGETVNFAAIIRKADWTSPGEIPVLVKMLRPDGKEYRSFRKTLNEEGAFEGSVELADAALTGTYTLEVYTSSHVLLGSKNINVEEFMPDRIRLNVKTDKPSAKPGESVTLDINASSFFGPPAAGRNYETEVQIRPVSFSSDHYSDYNFSLANEGVTFDKIFREGKTDASGNGKEKFEFPELYKNSGLLKALYYVTVFDETGRPVSRNAQTDIYTQDVFFGIKRNDYNYFPLNQPVKFYFLALNKEKKPVNAKAEIKVIRKEYRTVLAKAGSYFRYDSQKEEIVVAEQTLDIKGEQTAYAFTPVKSGDYEVRIYLPGANSFVSESFYSYGYWGTGYSSFEVNPEGQITIEADKNVYKPGDKARLLFKAPFNGKMLVTIEKDKLLYHHYVEVNNRTADLETEIDAAYLPNAYITATLIKPHQESDIPLTVAYGYKNISVEEPKRKMNVSIQTVESSRSKTKQTVTVKADPGSMVTLAAVDNGVLQVSDFRTPNPYAFFYGKKALETKGYSIYPLLFPELSSTGGDGDLELTKRVNPMPAKRVKILSYWSGIKTTGKNGEAKFDVEIPEFSGEVRLMAVAFKQNSFGASDKAMTVADPLVISPSIPRFLTPEDNVIIPVTISNTTDKAIEAKLELKISGPLGTSEEKNKTISVAPNSEHRVDYAIHASDIPGTGKIEFVANALGEKFTSTTEISIRPASPLQRRTGSGTLKGGGKTTINLPVRDLIPSSTDYKLVVSRNPAVLQQEVLRYLVQYPYGCTEQVISASFPQLYFSELANSVQTEHFKNAPSHSNVREALRKIAMRQLYNGGVLMWEGSGAPNWWVTIYAAHFALEAQKAGYDVDAGMVEKLMSYISHRLKSRETILYTYNRTENKKIAAKEVAYSLYVLALAGRPDVSAMNYYKAHQDLLSLDSRYLLSAAYAISGDKKRFAELLPASFSGEESTPATGGSFYSPLRDEAIALNALLEADPGNAQIPIMARHVAEQLNSRTWYSTQEAAFSFIALGKIASQAATSTVEATVSAGGKTVGKAGRGITVFTSRQLAGQQLEISTTGEGNIYYFWETEGISSTGEYKEEDSFIKIRRAYFDRNGNRINGNVFRRNDLVIVQLTVEKNFSGKIENLAISDLLPAGFEIENPRTKEIPGMDWIKDSRSPYSLDVRDDRINIFDDLLSQKQVYYYAVRAVSPGEFHHGPASADAMYQGEFHSYHGAGKVIIRE
jgi:uncharacterized protein YfaS (alpha-2-macroglobulin family)